MVTLDEMFNNEKTYANNPYIGNFIDRGLIHFNNYPKDSFFVDDKLGVALPLEPPLNGPVILADEYNELGIWIPTKPTNTSYRAIMTVWASVDIDEDITIRFLYLTTDGRLVLCREEIDYSKVSDATLDELIVKFFV